ncbi:MAG: vitamin K epoxide reductase family protein [Candidatus Dormibacteraeota bacterium]|nr:vitamin K epoxide reductase family protein [Candidatus Dormibacteraeota bacterium]
MLRQKVVALASLAGAGISIYLTIVHYSTVPLACPQTSMVNCEQVLSSSFAVIGGSGVPTSAAGIVWFVVSGGLAVAFWLWPKPVLPMLQLAWSGIGLMTVLFLLYIEIVQLGAVCIWCTGAHVLVLLIFLVSLNQPATRVREG